MPKGKKLGIVDGSGVNREEVFVTSGPADCSL